MDMLVQTYNTFFGNKTNCFRLSCLSYKLRKDILPFENHAIFFPQPANIGTESHPVKVNQKGSAWHMS